MAPRFSRSRRRSNSISSTRTPGQASSRTWKRALLLLRVGGIYFVDDLLPQPSWPEGHAPKVPVLIGDLERQRDFVATKLAWASGLMILVRTHAG